MDKNTLKELIRLKQNSKLTRPLFSETNEKANNARCLAWLLFDNFDELIIHSKSLMENKDLDMKIFRHKAWVKLYLMSDHKLNKTEVKTNSKKKI